MNKTVTINISGIIFNIDEIAFNKLHQYLETIKSFFSSAEGREEIMTDIEARIAEMFQERINDKNQVISIKDVEYVITIMGEPEAYIDEETTDQKTYAKANTSSKRAKRLYRDSESKVIGGVASGIAHYFGVDPVVIRIVFVLFFVFWGTGVFVYLVLWLITPEALTPTEKLEMRGEAVNLDNIMKTVNEEAQNLKNKFNDLSDKAKKTDFSGMQSKTKNVAESIAAFILNIATLFFKFFGKFLGIILSFLGFFGLIALIIFTFSSPAMFSAIGSDGSFSFSLIELSEVFFPNLTVGFLGILGVFLTLTMPVFLILLLGLKLLAGNRIKLKYLGSISFGIWILGLTLSGIISVITVSQFSNSGLTENTLTLDSTQAKTVVLKVNNESIDFKNYIYRKHSSRNHDYFHISDNTIKLGDIDVDVRKSETDNFQIIVTKISRGSSYKDAAELSEYISYDIALNDSVILLNSFFEFPKDNKWRNQEVDILLLVPIGKSVFLDNSVKPYLDDVKNVSNTWDWNMTGLKWTMLSPGLTCINCFEGWQGKSLTPQPD